MISLERVAKPAQIRSFCQRNGSVNNFSTLAIAQGASGKYKSNLEVSWLVAKGGTGKNLSELWSSYLVSKGFTSGNLKDKIKAFMSTGTQS